MNSFIVNLIGYMAAFCGTILMVPQAFKTFRTKHVADISLMMLVIYIINCLLWGTYGIFLNSNPIIVCNIISLVIGILMLIMKILFSVKP
jgi:MtN3 and saliva related transmembrane protein